MKIENFLNKHFDFCNFTDVLTTEQVQDNIELMCGINPKNSDASEPDYILNKYYDNGWTVKTINGVTVWANLNDSVLKKVLRKITFRK